MKVKCENGELYALNDGPEPVTFGVIEFKPGVWAMIPYYPRRNSTFIVFSNYKCEFKDGKWISCELDERWLT